MVSEEVQIKRKDLECTIPGQDGDIEAYVVKNIIVILFSILTSFQTLCYALCVCNSIYSP